MDGAAGNFDGDKEILIAVNVIFMKTMRKTK